METTVAIISAIGGLITALIAASSYIRGRKEEAKAKLSEAKKRLAQQVIAYYCEEQMLLDELAAATGKNAETLKREYRQKAANHEKNSDCQIPEMTPSQAKRYL